MTSTAHFHDISYIEPNPIAIIDETLGITENIVVIQSISQVINENLGIADNDSSSEGFLRVINENLGIADNNNQIQELLQVINVNLGIIDSNNQIQELLQVINENLGITDIIINQIVLIFLTSISQITLNKTLSKSISEGNVNS